MPDPATALPTAPSRPNLDAPLATVANYAELLNVCRHRLRELQLDYATLDAMTDGRVSKLLAPPERNGGRLSKRHFSPDSFDACMEALGLGLVLVENAARTARLRAFCGAKLLKREGPIRRSAATPALVTLSVTRDFLREIGRMGGAASGRKRHAMALKKKRISEISRRNALKRWQKHPKD